MSVQQRRIAGWVVAAGLAVAAGACETREIAEPKEKQQASGGRTLVFSDDFERDRIGDDWSVGEGEGGPGRWKIEDGWVHGENIKNDPLWLDRKLPKNVRIEFDARSESSKGDIKFEVFGDGRDHESGYICIYGGWGNKLDVIARLDEHGEDRKERSSEGVESGRTYRMAVERTDGTLEWYVDGELFMSYDDPEPLRGAGHRHFAFNDWTVPVEFDNVRVYRLR